MPILEFDLPKSDQSIIKVIGVGGGGSNAVNHMFKQGIVGVDFAICNTDHQALDLSPIPNKIQLGPGLTDGMGAGSKPEVGKHACIESIEDVQTFLAQSTKMLFVTAGMGGGTGTGAAPIIAKAAREMGILTVGIVTLPFQFEGKLRAQFAKDGLEELKRNVDSLIVISNDKLREIHGNLALSEAFAQADDILTTAAKGIAEIITIPGYINVDFEDVNTVMRNSGVAIMGSAMAEGEDRARRAVDNALNSPLLEDNNISGAINVLLNISSGKKEATMDEISEITEFVQTEAGMGTNIIWGNCYDETLGDKISVTLIASGFEKERSVSADEASKHYVSLDDVFVKDDQKNPAGHSNVVDLSAQTIRETAATHSASQFSEPVVRGDQHVGDQSPKVAASSNSGNSDFRQGSTRVHLNNPQTIIEMENTPAFVRRRVVLDEVPHSTDRNYSRWSVAQNDELIMRQDTPFLRDLAD